jgi:mannose-1-phosphate guanylyltransferase
MKRGDPWVVLLAGTDEMRAAAGSAAGPGSHPRLAWAAQVAGGLVAAERVVVVVEDQQGAALWLRAAGSAQRPVPLPGRRGTGAYLLAALFAVLAQDTRARLVVAQIDEAGMREEHLGTAVRGAAQALAAMPERLVLVAERPQTADPNRGWIIPSSEFSPPPVRKVAAFIERPDVKTAQQLLNGGALVSAGVFAAGGRALLDLYIATAPRLVREFVRWRGEANAPELGVQLAGVPPCDFNRAVLEWAHGSLAVIPQPRSADRVRDAFVRRDGSRGADPARPAPCR